VGRLAEAFNAMTARLRALIGNLEQRVAERTRGLRAVAEVSRATTSVLELDALLGQVVDLVRERFDLYYVGLFLLDGAEQNAVLHAGTGEAGRQMLERGHRLQVDGPSMVGQCVAHNEARIAPDAGAEAMRFANPLLPETRAEVALPLRARGRIVGAMSVQSAEAGAFDEAAAGVLQSLADQVGVAIDNARLFEQIVQANAEIRALNERLQEENLRMEAELDVTRRLQQMLLPAEEELRQVEGLDIATYMEPAEEVGGDYYDVLYHDGQVKIGIGDVTGHGLESGVVMLMLQTAVRTLLTSGERDPIDFMKVLNRILHDNIRRMRVDKSLTLALLDYESGRADGNDKLRLSGQHEHLIVLRQEGRVELVDTFELGFPLGLEHDIAPFVGELSVDLAPGDGVVLYSDGFTEAENARGEFYGLDRLCAVASQHWPQPANGVKEAIVADVHDFIGEQTVYDDLTLVVLKRK
jgi:serine phosphatase RsbU (regulator of sigma subunit)